MIPWDMIRQKCPKLYKNGIVFECGKGWSHIILELSLDIEALLEKKPHYSEIYAIQVKEKYGTLRFYMTLETDEITALIEDAEALSSQTCESCGSSGKMRGVRWMEVKCEECFKDLIWR